MIVVSLPSGLPRTRVAQGSPLVLAGVLVSVDSSVGKGTEVFVAAGVDVGVSVGGRGVLVGIAACVSATIVNAADTAVDCTSPTLRVGTAGSPPPHPAIKAEIARTERRTVNFFIIPFLLGTYTVEPVAP